MAYGHRRYEYVKINSNPSNAQVRVFDGNLLIFSGTTPTKVRFDRSQINFMKDNKTRYRVLVTKSGYEPREFIVQPRWNGINLWDISIGLGMMAGGIAWLSNTPYETKINDDGIASIPENCNRSRQWHPQFSI